MGTVGVGGGNGQSQGVTAGVSRRREREGGRAGDGWKDGQRDGYVRASWGAGPRHEQPRVAPGNKHSPVPRGPALRNR